MATENFIIDVQFHKNLLYGQVVKEIALTSTSGGTIHHWFVRPPSFLEKIRATGKLVYYRKKFRCKQLRNDMTYGESITEIKQLTNNCKILYATGLKAIEWLASNVPCTISADLPPLHLLPYNGQRCTFHSVSKHATSNCAYNIVVRLLKLSKQLNRSS